MKTLYDVVIVGAGPSGSTLGYLLSERGIEVLVIDKERFPRQKLCGGCLAWKTRQMLERLFQVSFDKRFNAESISNEYQIYEKFKLKISQKSPEPFYFMDRKECDMELVKLAEKKGCPFLLGQKVMGIDIQNNIVLAESGHSLQGHVIVGADGANSLIRRKIFPSENLRHDLSLAFQISVPIDRLRLEYRHFSPGVFAGIVKAGYGWIFPLGDHSLVGLWGLMRKNENLKGKYRDFFKKVTDLDLGKQTAIPAHLALSALFKEDPGKNRILLVGDAAGLIDPLTGEGIYYAHKSAECASKALLDYFDTSERMDLLQFYKNHLTPVLKELIISKRLSRLAYSPLRYVAYFFKRNSKFYQKLAETIHGIKHYSQVPFFSRWIKLMP